MHTKKMKPSQRSIEGLTLFEVAVVIAALVLFGAVMLPQFVRENHPPSRITCVNNLKQIGVAYRIWENDNGDKYPMQQLESAGGMVELVTNSASIGRYAYLPYSLMQNELGQSPKVVLCPSDDRSYSDNFYYGRRNAPSEKGYPWPAHSPFGSFDNTNVSYFVGVGAIDTDPQSILGGDRNLGDGGTDSRPAQDPAYGLSGTNSSPDYPCGADAIVNTNGRWSEAAVAGGGGHVNPAHRVAWSAKMHSDSNIAGAGNILLGDGSAQQCTSAGLRATWLKNAADTGNFAASDKLHSSTNGDIRFLFP
jgi:hypothetical protein